MREKQKMSEYIETVSTEDANAVIDSKLRKVFDGRIDNGLRNSTKVPRKKKKPPTET